MRCNKTQIKKVLITGLEACSNSVRRRKKRGPGRSWALQPMRICVFASRGQALNSFQQEGACLKRSLEAWLSPSGGRPWSAWRAQKDCKAAKQLYGLIQRMQTREKRLSKGFRITRQSKAVNPSEITEIDGINERGEGKTAGLEKRKGKRNSSWFSNWPPSCVPAGLEGVFALAGKACAQLRALAGCISTTIYIHIAYRTNQQ